MATANPTPLWSDGITLTVPTLFSANLGSVYLSFEDAKPAEDEKGISLSQGSGLVVPAGNKVYWKLNGVAESELWYGQFLA